MANTWTEPAIMNTDYIPAQIVFDGYFTFEQQQENETATIHSISISTGYLQDNFVSYGGATASSCSVTMSALEPAYYYARIIDIGSKFEIKFYLEDEWKNFGTFYIQNEPVWTEDELSFSGVGKLAADLNKPVILSGGKRYPTSKDPTFWSVDELAESITRYTGTEVIFDNRPSNISELMTSFPLIYNEDEGSWNTNHDAREVLATIGVMGAWNAVERDGAIHLTTIGTGDTMTRYFGRDTCTDMTIGQRAYAPSPVKISYQPYKKEKLRSVQDWITEYVFVDGDKKEVTVDTVDNWQNGEYDRTYELTIENDYVGPFINDTLYGYGLYSACTLRTFHAEFIGYHPFLHAGATISVNDKDDNQYQVLCDKVTYNWDGGMSIEVTTDFEPTMLENAPKEQEIALMAVAEEEPEVEKATPICITNLTPKNEAKIGGVRNSMELKTQIDKELDENSENAVENKAIAIPIHDILGTNSRNTNATDRVNGNLTLAGNNNKVEDGENITNSVVTGSGNTVSYGTTDCFVSGGGNSVSGGTDSLVTGRNNKVTSGSTSFSMIDVLTNSILTGSNNEIIYSGGVVGSSIIGGTGNKIEAGSIHQSLVCGWKNTISHDMNFSIVTGNNNTTTGKFNDSYLGGYDNTVVHGGHSTIVSGHDNKIGGRDASIDNSIISGNSNTMENGAVNSIVTGFNNTAKVYMYSSIVSGRGNTLSIEIDESIIGGMSNQIGTSRQSVIGGNDNNIASVEQGIISGSNNTVTGNCGQSVIGGNDNNIAHACGSLVIGRGNTVSSEAKEFAHGILGGLQNDVQTELTCSLVLGNNLTLPKTEAFSSVVLLGQYNEPFNPSDYAFVIGGGSSDTDRKNLLALTRDGSLEVNGEKVGGGSGVEDITADCSIEVAGNILTVTVPFNTIMKPEVAKGYLASASFTGGIRFNGRPEMEISLNVSYIQSIVGLAPVEKGSASLDMSQTITGTPFASHIDGTLVSVTNKGSYFEAVFNFELDNALGYTYSVNTFQIMRQGGGAVNFSIPSMQEQEAKIQSLTQTIEELTARIEALENQ